MTRSPGSGIPALRRWRPAVSGSTIGAAREFRATAAAAWGIPSSLIRRPARVEARAPRAAGARTLPPGVGVRGRAAPPVVLVHGFAGSSASWSAVRGALRTDGRTVVSFDYFPWASSVDDLADRLVGTVQDV